MSHKEGAPHKGKKATPKKAKSTPSHPAKPYHEFCKKLRPGLKAMGLTPTQIAKECSRLWHESGYRRVTTFVTKI